MSLQSRILERRKANRKHLPLLETYEGQLNNLSCAYKQSGGICINGKIETKVCTKEIYDTCPFRKPIRKKENKIPTNLITVCITYYRRPQSLAILLQSIEDFYPELTIEILDTQGNLSWGRNELSKRCQTPFYFMLEEDMEITERSNINNALQILQSDKTISGVGGVCYEPGRDRVTWHHDFPSFPEQTKEASIKPTRSINGITYQPCDLVLNFGLFRNSLFKSVAWDESRPIAEHTEFYMRASRQHQFAFLDTLSCLHHRNRKDDIYNAQRKRAKGLVDITIPSKKQTQFTAALAAFNTAMKNAGIQYFLSDGTLLGCHRENRFIEHDPDIDVGAFFGFDEGRVIACCLDKGITLEKTYGTPEEGRQLVFRKDGIKVDLFTYYWEDNLVWHPIWQGSSLIKYWYKPFRLKQRTFASLQVLVPQDEEKYLIQQYGPNWKTPIRDWSWVTSPHNLSKPITN